MFQSIINCIYRHPKNRIRHFNKFGGYLNYRKIENGRKKMISAAIKLPPIVSYNDGLPIYFLTGKKYLYQTLFCIQSLALSSNKRFCFFLVDDGSFDKTDFQTIARQLPNCIIYDARTIDKQLENKLPLEKYPFLHKKRKIYPHIKKLTDIHIFDTNEWKLVLDSDMLFWNTPKEIINWLERPSKPIYMLDCGEAYGYSYELMQQVAGSSITPLINVGAIGLKSATIDWESIEKWGIELEKREGESYYLEQALSAMLIGNSDSYVLPKNYYVVNPKKIETSDVLHHYVDLSKELYFKDAWPAILYLTTPN